MKKPPTVIIDDNAFSGMRNVDFFLRIHRHLPDDHCGASGFPFGKCNYRPDGAAINHKNERVKELQKDPEFIKKEQEISEAVKKKFGD